MPCSLDAGGASWSCLNLMSYVLLTSMGDLFFLVFQNKKDVRFFKNHLKIKLSFISYFKNKGSLQFEDKWDFMRPIVLKLLRQESVTKQQWFDLFS